MNKKQKYEIIQAYGLRTRIWVCKYHAYGCAECCNGDRCDDDCIAPYKGRRNECPHCKGKGWIPKEDVVNFILAKQK